jgi:hypothetical protein
LADRVIRQITVGDPLAHPAVAAWNRMTGAGAAPRSILRLNKGHSVVYRLTGLAPDGSSVIAKLCRQGDVQKARDIYLRVLPLVPKPALTFHGSQKAHFHAGWLFVEDAGAEYYADGNPRHRSAVSAWLGALHASLARHSQDFSLPETGLCIYRRKLSDALGRITRSLGHVESNSDDVATLRSALRLCERIESQWNQIGALVADGPCTVVHGDLAPKNILLREAAGRIEVFPVDWDTAGWGPPAADLGDPLDLTAYLDQARKLGTNWRMPEVARWAAAGRVLRHIAAIEWASTRLEGGWPPRGVRRIAASLPALEAAELETCV